jgi:hypothetical protein
MKKLLLLSALVMSLVGQAQHNKQDFKPLSPKAPDNIYFENSAKAPNVRNGNTQFSILKSQEVRQDVDFVNPIPIGQAGNAFGFAYFRTTYLWADNNINSISFIHRMMSPPGTGYLAYDYSTDGGWTWTNNVQTYNPTNSGAFEARYPQGAIYNPEGNSDPGQAFFHYFAPTLDGSNSGGDNTWGGYAYGVKSLTDGPVLTQHNQTSTPPYHQYLPSAFTITQTGDAWMVDENTLGNETDYTYQGSIIVGRGLWNYSTKDFEYIFSLIDMPVNSEDGINDIKIAFSPDGMTGYICVMTNMPETLPYTSYHPVLFKTTDGGDNWSDPIEVQLGGDDGLAPVQEFISDSILTLFYDPQPVPARNEIPYYIGYECDLSVDAWGNPHLSGTVCITDLAEGLIYTSEGLISMFHIWSEDQGESWKAYNLSNLKRFKAEFTADGSTIEQFNRPQVATTMDGAIVFFSWLDTESPDVADNSQPDIFFRDYQPILDQHGESAENVTFMSAGMWSAYYGCMSHYVFSEISGETYTCTIPLVYEQMVNADPTQQVQFYYIPDFVKTYTVTGIENPDNPQIVVAQNYPNPFSSTSMVRINLLKDNNVKLEIHNMAGQLVDRQNLGAMQAGIHDLTINAAGLSPGIYFYSLLIDSGKITKKMIVR